jgi:hypothetical protein
LVAVVVSSVSTAAGKLACGTSDRTPTARANGAALVVKQVPATVLELDVHDTAVSTRPARPAVAMTLAVRTMGESLPFTDCLRADAAASLGRAGKCRA